MFQGVFCEGSVRVTIWRSGGLVLLTAENDPRGLWFPDEYGQLQWQEGAGIRLAGSLLHYTVTAQDFWEGYLVLPPTTRLEEISCAEVTLGHDEKLLRGEVSCRLASPAELVATEPVRQSIARAQDEGSRRAWDMLLASPTADLNPTVRQAIQEAMASDSANGEPKRRE